MDILNIQPTDIAIFLVSSAACIYCIVLSRRLKALQNTRDGLGATITALSTSISVMTATTQDTRTRVESMAARLSHLIDEGEKMCERLESTIMHMETTQTQVADQVHASQTELNMMMRGVLDQSRERIAEMTTLMRQMRVMSDDAASLTPQPRSRSA